ncbi:hypothetical protein PIROE2DRAFT_20418 [Piromyces sp. E2]|nr:hypothetical protein PIROE2DRAFT_20418 [Piromyces sp. E2]|eukprot:OUM64884.1 hypothetical protein PIROE2DRAFT_20418 [Piromyces sp. E2]
MKFFNLFISVLLLSVGIFAQDQTCQAEIDTEYYCALSTQLGSFCENYVVVMETRANAKNLVRVKVVDSCVDCPTYHVDLSKKAYTTLAEESSGQSDIIWGIYSDSGELIRGPFYNDVTEIAESYGLSENSFIAAFKVLAGRIAANGSSSGTFNITRGPNTIIKKTTVTNSQPTQGTEGEQNNEVPLTEISASPENQVEGEAQNFDVENNDTINYDANAGSDMGKLNNDNDYSEPIVINQSPDSVPVNETDDSKSGSSTVGAIAALSCFGASGVGLVFLKKKNPSKYDELKKKFPEAFSNVKRRASNLRRSKSNGNEAKVTLPTTNNYMPTDNIEDEEVPRITVYDAQDPLHRN